MSGTFSWPNDKRGAVSFTFDDARDTQPTACLPILDAAGVRATFYILPGPVESHPDPWRTALARGHEIGNHTLTHPCSGNYPWSRAKALEDWTLDKIAADITAADTAIERLLAARPRTFAYPCGQTFVGRGRDLHSYIPLIADRFLAGRGYLSAPINDPAFCDLAHLCATSSDAATVPQLTDLIATAAAEGRWVIFASHEVADTGRQALAPAVLEAACRYAADERHGLWVDTVANIAQYIHDRRA